MIKINYPDVNFGELINIDDKEVLYWLYRTTTLKDILSEVFKSVIAIERPTELTIGFIAPILDRQIELANSVFVLMLKGRIRDSAILFLTLYELTLDMQYVACNPGSEKIWMQHTKLNTKPWKVSDQIKAIFKKESESEKETYKHFSSIKHGNYAANEFAFNLMVKDKKVMLKKLETGMLVPNLRAIAIMFDRTAHATFSMLKGLNIEFHSLQQTWEQTYDKLNSDLMKLLQIKLLDITYGNDIEKKKELIDKLNLTFDF